MKLEINTDWLLRMADKEGSGIVSVGGLVTRMKEEIAALPTLSAWQPIETAPMEEGQDFLLFGIRAGVSGKREVPRIWTGCWWPSSAMSPGWWSSTPNTGEIIPTHWMPLPSPPTLPQPPAISSPTPEADAR